MNVSNQLLRRRDPAPATCPIEFKEDFNRLLNDQPAWAARFAGGQLVYALPRLVFREGSPLRDLFNDEDYKAEEIFANVCHGRAYIGCQNGRGVSYTPLKNQSLWIDLILEYARWFPEYKLDRKSLDDLRIDLEGHQERLLGYVGFLLTEREFTTEFEAFQRDFVPMEPRDDDPGRRILPNLSMTRPAVGGRLGLNETGYGPMYEYDCRLADWLERWGVVELATWDWPLPQGPVTSCLASSLVRTENRILPRQAACVYIPAGYNLASDRDLSREIRRQQVAEAEAAGLPPELAGMDHHAVYAQMARIIHIDRTLRSRFPDGELIGFVQCMVQAAALACDLSEDRVQVLWKHISRCRRGERNMIKELAS